MEKGKKKQGSTLVIVLAVAMVCLTLGSAIITSIMGTIKANISQKEREDLRYAAEGGLEIAKSHFKEGNATIDTRSTPTDSKKVEILESGIVDSVEVYLEDEKVKSVAKHINGSSEEIIMAKYKKLENEGNATSIFDHGIVAGKGGIEIVNGGSMTAATSTVSTGNGINVSGNDVVIKDVEENNIRSVNFKNWKASEKEILIRQEPLMNTDNYNIQNHDFYTRDENGKLKEVTVTRIKMDMETKYNLVTQKWEPGTLKVVGSKESPFDYLKKIEKKPIVVIDIVNLNGPRKFSIVMINSKELKFEISGSIAMTNIAIINEGVITIGGEAGRRGTVELNDSTIFGEKVLIGKDSSMTVIEQPAKDDTGGILLDKEEEDFNTLIGAVLDDWTGNSGSGNGSYESIEVEENSFSN